MSKKITALFTAILMVASLLCSAAGAEDSVCVSNALDDCQAMVGSLIGPDTGTVNISGKSLKINTQNAAYGLNGNPDVPDKYNASYNGSRRTKLAGFEDGKTLPEGTYTVSLYVYENGNHLGDQLSHVSEIALSFHSAEETDDTLAYNHANYELIKLFKANASDTSNSFQKSGVELKVGTRTWGEYTAQITVTEPVSQFAFWIIIDGDVGEQATISTWIDNLSVYNEAGAPEQETSTEEIPTSDGTGDDTSGSIGVETDNGATAANTDTSAGTASSETEEEGSEAVEKKGCGASVGAVSLTLIMIGTSAAGVVVRKKKIDRH